MPPAGRNYKAENMSTTHNTSTTRKRVVLRFGTTRLRVVLVFVCITRDHDQIGWNRYYLCGRHVC